MRDPVKQDRRDQNKKLQFRNTATVSRCPFSNLAPARRTRSEGRIIFLEEGKKARQSKSSWVMKIRRRDLLTQNAPFVRHALSASFPLGDGIDGSDRLPRVGPPKNEARSSDLTSRRTAASEVRWKVPSSRFGSLGKSRD